ncbi:MAG: type II toxin-antitoxin system Phd/YefM family antitoxin [Sulfuricurvum sp.]
MTKAITASQARANIFTIMDEAASSHEPILITGKRNNVVMLSQEDWNAIQETLFLVSIPNMKESIIEGMNTPIAKCSEELEW